MNFKRNFLLLMTLAAIALLFTACDWSSFRGSSSSGTPSTPAPAPTEPSSPEGTAVPVTVTGSIEATYAAAGPYAVATTSVTGYQIFHPSKMEGDHPIITWGNGTGAPTLSYNALLRHLASWGFVVVASSSTATQSGQEMIGGIDYLIEENKKSGSKFYNMIDPDSIGTTGHSQGGGGAINAATDPRVTCTAPLAPSPGQIRQVKCPTFLVAGSADTMVSASLVRSMCWTPATAPTIFGIIDGIGHMDFIGNGGRSRGYVTAWFMHHLKGDQVAQQAFQDHGELFSNSAWKVEKKNL